jgi:hypothetical protein
LLRLPLSGFSKLHQCKELEDKEVKHNILSY